MAFYEKLSTYYDELFPLRESRLSFVLSNLLKPDVLDIGCATGDLAIALSKNDYTLTGIDLDEDMIKIAKRKINNNKIIFKVENMLNIKSIFKNESFNSILCLGNTLVHLKDLVEFIVFFKSIRTLLKNNGIFIIQIVNYDRILKKEIRTLPDLKRDGLLFERKYVKKKEKDNLEFIGILTIDKNEKKLVSTEILYPLTSQELKECLIEAGFINIKVFGDEKHSKFTEESPAIIAVIKKT